MEQWYCAQAVSGKEVEVAKTLQRVNKFPTFIPVYLSKNKSYHVVQKYLFPGYLFVQLPNIAFWPRVKHTQFVINFLTFQPSKFADRLPTPIPQSSIDSMLALVDEHSRDCFLNKPTHNIHPGSKVRILDGPLAKEQAICTMSTSQRIWVLASMFKREVKMEFLPHQLELVAA